MSVTEAQAAAVRARRGARWLDETFPDWEERINVNTLDLSIPWACICGQVFAQDALDRGTEIGSGYGFAKHTLFSEANSWITTIIKLHTKSEGLDPDTEFLRGDLVSTALGFNEGEVETSTIESDAIYVHFEYLQDAWLRLLKKRAKANA